MDKVFKTVNYSNTVLSEMPQTEALHETVFGVRTGSIGLLIPIVIYCEVLGKTPVNILPNVHPWVSVLLNLRGNLVPVFDLSIILEEKPDSAKNRRLFVLDKGEKTVALWIDDFPEIKNGNTLQPLKNLPQLPLLLQRFVTKGYEQDGKVWLSIKFEEFFTALGHHQFLTEEMAA